MASRPRARQRIATSLQVLRESSPAEFSATIEGVSRLAAEVVDATDTLLCLSTRSGPKNGSLGGWRPLPAYRFGPNAERDQKILGQWYRTDSRRAADPSVSALLRTNGRPRAFLRREVADDEAWHQSGIDALFEESGIGDRLVMASPLRSDVELLLLTYRRHTAPPFDATDRDAIIDLASEIRGIGTTIARVHGLMDEGIPLTQQERNVLRLLLLGLSESHAAVRLGLTTRSLHQYVVAIYRKLRVRSRGELMAYFLTPDRRERALARCAYPLSEREREVFGALIRGLSEKEIAHATQLTSRAVHHLVGAIYRKAGVRSRSALLAQILAADIET